jgi:hypothetical protein
MNDELLTLAYLNEAIQQPYQQTSYIDENNLQSLWQVFTFLDTDEGHNFWENVTYQKIKSI